jgi:Domain of unknown function (DUF4148)
MTTKTFFIAALTALTTFGATAAFAGEATYDYPVSYSSTLTRAAVKADVLRARAAGLIAQGEHSVVIAETGPALTRAQVKAETLEAIRIGEHSVVPTAAQLDSIRLAGLKAVAMTMASL